MKSESNEARVLFYCLGAGMGHLTRAAAMSRKLRRLIKGEIAIITNSPFHYLLDVEDVNCIYLKNLMILDESTGNLIRSIIKQMNPELFIVDSYPLGVRNELLPLLNESSFRKAFIRRNINEKIISLSDMTEYTQNYYDLVIDCENMTPLNHHAEVQCCPILIRDQEELLAPEVAREVLLCKNSEKILLVVATGSRDESISFFRQTEKVFSEIRQESFRLRYASPYNLSELKENWYNIKYFPLLELFYGVDILMGYTGTNLYYETKALDLPTIFLIRSNSTVNEDQFVDNAIPDNNNEELEKKLRELMEKSITTPEVPVYYENNAQKAAAYLTQLLFSGGNLRTKEYKDKIDWFLM